MTKKQLRDRWQQTRDSLGRLREGLQSLEAVEKDPLEYGLHVDAVVKRFEALFEYTWKMLKSFSEYQGIEAPGPRPAIQEAVRFGWIGNPEFWAQALDARNGSVHDYFGISEEEYLKIATDFGKEVEGLLEVLGKLSY